MAKLTAAQRKNLSKSQFAIPSKAPGSGSYPVNDPAHARAALSRVAQHGSPAEQATVRAKVRAKFPSIGADARKSTKGSPVFSTAELAQGHRKLGSCPMTSYGKSM